MSDVVSDRVRRFIVENFLFGDEAGIPADDESLIGSGVVDSTGVLELVDFLEEDLGVTVADHETVPANLDSIENIVAFVVRKNAG